GASRELRGHGARALRARRQHGRRGVLPQILGITSIVREREGVSQSSIEQLVQIIRKRRGHRFSSPAGRFAGRSE
ncbi:MAG: hypothetical protein ACXWH7_11170, partial [Thermoanaerobaculia bacterium]